jgi:hypothetical protein
MAAIRQVKVTRHGIFTLAEVIETMIKREQRPDFIVFREYGL